MSLSPLFGKSDITTFERYFLEKENFKLFPETKNSYYTYSVKKEYCKKILEEFELDKNKGIIINGHMPVKIKKGEQPIKAGGKQIIIDGGISKAYQKVTGIAGYTLISNSHGTKLVAHEVFESKENAIVNNQDILHSVTIVNSFKDNILIKDTYNGIKIKKQIEELKELVKAYQTGLIASKE
jgi:fructose-1,6-bisphosphatase-3